MFRRHLCEFTGLDLEMAINSHYEETLQGMKSIILYEIREDLTYYYSDSSNVPSYI